MIVRPLLFVCLLSLSAALAAKGLPVAFVEDFEGNRIALYIDKDELAQAPNWKPGHEPLPLRVDQALAAVRKWALKEHPDYEDLRFREIALKSIHSISKGEHWHYLVYFDGVIGGYVVRQPHLFVAVLFDGKVIPAVVEPAR